MNLTPVICFHIINFFRYKILYKKATVSPKAMIFKTKLWYKTNISWEVGCFNCEIWDFTYLNAWLWGYFWNQISTNITNTKIWKFCSIGNRLFVPSWTHKTKNITTFPINSIINKDNEEKDLVFKKTVIWNDVWIWVNVIIISWVEIGDGAIIWAWSVVTKDIESYSVVWWVPAKLIKYRYEKWIIDILLKIKWWDRPIEKIKENSYLLSSENITDFIHRFW